MGYVEGNTVIVTTEGKNQVAVELVANDLIPHLDANSAGKASW